jgi:catechol 2,3-dioxygenase-like lactoylglutathione lyase family enzyme
VIETWGLTHIALAVRDVARASRFYRDVFGAVVVYDHGDFVQLQTPGTRDVLVLERNPDEAGRAGGIVHFGYRLKDAKDIEAAAAAVVRAGGRIKDKGEFVPGEPYLYAYDPDGYEVEIWFELPTPVDPKPATRPAAGSRRRSRS